MIIRHARTEDVKELCSILNEIINIGGSTAFEEQLGEKEFESYFVNGKKCISCFVAEENDFLYGFQSLTFHPKLENGWADIATFSRVAPKLPGVGTALFSSTVDYALREKFLFINATIRADNQSGLAYYSKMGFKDYAVTENVPLLNGKLVDRISRKYTM